MPRVSIGLPVFNGENYIEKAIESILKQTYSDIELIISDNASTDSTSEICRYYVDYDRRVKYFRNEKNIGASNNFNKTFFLSRGEYFKWIAHDDLIAPDYIEECLNVLDRDPSIILCNSDIIFIDENGKFIKKFPEKIKYAASIEPHLRFKDVVKLNHWCIDVFGLIRSNVLRQTRLIDNYVESDRPLLVNLCLIGRFYRIKKPLFFSREHNSRSIRVNTLYERGEWWSPKLKGKRVMPRFRIFFEYIRLIAGSELTRSNKIKCYITLLMWLKSSQRQLRRDIETAFCIKK